MLLLECLQVVHDERGMRVCDLYEGSSSYWSTLKIDDIVCAVDGQDIRHGPPSLVLQLTNGCIGTGMCLHVIRKESSDDEIAGALSARGRFHLFALGEEGSALMEMKHNH